MDRNEVISILDKYKDTFVEQYNAFKLEGSLPYQALKAGRNFDLVREYYGLYYFCPDANWAKPRWNPSLSERWFFFQHRIKSKILKNLHIFTEADQQKLWTIRGGENYSFESETAESRDFAVRFFNEFFQAFPLNKDAPILELGCGSGRNLKILREMGFSNLKGVDFSPTQVKFCREQGLDVQKMNITRLSFPEDSFDLVFTNSVLLHVPPDKISSAIKEAVRVSRRLVAFRENTYDEETFKGHVYKYNYFRRIDEVGFHAEKIGEFIVIQLS